MRKSQKNNSKMSRFVYYKYSGLIVFIPLIILGIGVYSYMELNKEFFTAWSCETVADYVNEKDVPENIPLVHELDSSQYSKLENIVNECNSMTKFNERIKLD